MIVDELSRNLVAASWHCRNRVTDQAEQVVLYILDLIHLIYLEG